MADSHKMFEFLNSIFQKLKEILKIYNVPDRKNKSCNYLKNMYCRTSRSANLLLPISGLISLIGLDVYVRISYSHIYVKSNDRYMIYSQGLTLLD